MRTGVELLRTHARAWEAFRLANAAMLEQRARADWIRAGAPKPGPTRDDGHRWRPFQIAFILMCLEDIVNPATTETRDEVDLLWFPTGGGKTEAYLGLIAFTVFHRRLREPAAGGGVTALMRYTTAATHDPTIRAGHPPSYRMRGDPPRAPRAGFGTDLNRAVGWPGRDPQHTPRCGESTQGVASSRCP